MKNVKLFEEFINEASDFDSAEAGLKKLAKKHNAKIFSPAADELTLFIPEPTEDDEYANKWQVYLTSKGDGWSVGAEHSRDGEMGARDSESSIASDVDLKKALAAIDKWCKNA